MLSIHPLRSARRSGPFGLYKALHDALHDADTTIRRGDVIAISTKFVSISQGRTIRTDMVMVSEEGRRVSRRFRMAPQVAELVVRESDHILGGMNGFVLAWADGIISPNAGIDSSNAGAGMAILYPDRPYRAAEMLRRRIVLETGVCAGVILTDSRLLPGRVGTVGVAVSYAGIAPVRDRRGDTDLDGRPLKVTFQAVADGLAAAANHTMGEGDEGMPFALIRGSDAVSDAIHDCHAATVHPSQCVYVRGLSGQ